MFDFSIFASLAILIAVFFAVLRINNNYKSIVNDLANDTEKMRIKLNSELRQLKDVVTHNRHAIHKLAKPKRRVSATQVSATQVSASSIKPKPKRKTLESKTPKKV